MYFHRFHLEISNWRLRMGPCGLQLLQFRLTFLQFFGQLLKRWICRCPAIVWSISTQLDIWRSENVGRLVRMRNMYIIVIYVYIIFIFIYIVHIYIQYAYCIWIIMHESEVLIDASRVSLRFLRSLHFWLASLCSWALQVWQVWKFWADWVDITS